MIGEIHVVFEWPDADGEEVLPAIVSAVPAVGELVQLGARQPAMVAWVRHELDVTEVGSGQVAVPNRIVVRLV